MPAYLLEARDDLGEGDEALAELLAALPLGEDVFLVLGGRPGGNGRGLGDVGDDHGVVASLDLAHLGEGCGHRVHLLLGLQGRAKGAAVVRDAPLTVGWFMASLDRYVVVFGL